MSIQRTGVWLVFTLLLVGSAGMTSEESPMSLTIVAPTSGGQAACTLTGSGGLIEVRGESYGLYGNGYQLLLFVNPQVAGARGWFVQFGENGVDRFGPDGRWSGYVQLGNDKFPPSAGQKISIVVVALPEDEATEALTSAQTSPDKPRRTYPQVPEARFAIAEDLIVSVSK